MMKVVLVDYTREPLKVLARATLVSYWDEWSIDRLDEISEIDAELHIPRVLGYGHESVLEHIKLTFAVEGVSVVTLKQITRHRLMSFTVRSQRYIGIGDNDDYVVPDEVLEKGFGKEYHKFMDDAFELYRKLVEGGVSPENARYVIPQAVMTKFVVSMNFREFKHYIGLRLCSRAQWEIRQLARMMWEEVAKVDDLKKLLVWAKVAPRCVQLGYCPERELMPEGCFAKQREWWNSVSVL